MAVIKRIALVGVTGNMGSHICKELQRLGNHTITALTRSDSQAKMPEGVQVARVDYNDPASLVSALRGHDALIITLGVRADPSVQTNLIAAAAEADIPYVVPNIWGTHPFKGASRNHPLLASALRALKQIEELGKSSWLVFVFGMWYEFSVGGTQDRYGFDFQNRSMIFYDDGKTLIDTTTWNQVARAVGVVMNLKEKPDKDDDQSLTLKGLENSCICFNSFTVSQKEVFESVLRVTGTKEEDWTVSYESARERWMAAEEEFKKERDLRAFGRALYARYFMDEEGYPSSRFSDKEHLFNEEFGLPKEDLDDRTKYGIELSKDTARWIV